MPVHVIKCPHCNAPLSPSRFARSTVCPFCSATVQLDPSLVSVARYREAFSDWNSPEAHGFSSYLSIGGGHWALERSVGRGELSDVFMARRARWPTERVVLKLLREGEDRALFAHEWDVLSRLHQSTAAGAARMRLRIPEPVAHGVVQSGTHEGRSATILRRLDGFEHTLEAVRAQYPSGVDPRASVWLWRRILETLSFVHASGLVHGAVLPQHLLVQDGEHGVHLVGYCCADARGAKLRAVWPGREDFYPAQVRRSGVLGPEVDLAMSARVIAWVLGGSAATGEPPRHVPGRYAALIQEVAAGESAARGAWSLREAVGTISQEVFGPPSFNPIPMMRT